MSIEEMGALVALALVDSTSIGTLVIPLWLVMSPRMETRRIAVYLTTLAGFYWTIGFALLSSMSWVPAAVEYFRASNAWLWSQLSIGAIVLIAGLLIDRQHPRSAARSPRLEKWRSRALRPTDLRGVVALALMAGALELAGMLPFLAAAGMVARSDLEPLHQGATLVAYVLIMMLPAVTLLTIRTVIGERLPGSLPRLERWLGRHSGGLIGTLLIVVGGLLAADAATRLDLLPQ